MSVENFDGNGLADQPSIIYSFSDEDGDRQIRELSRSGYGQPGPSPGSVIERDSTKSDPSTNLPELELPGQRGLYRDSCGESIPAFACADSDGCGHPIYVGSTCQSPTCERDWPSAVKEKVVRYAGKLDGLRRMIYADHDGRKDVDFNHVVASLPSFAVDSDEPLERALLSLKTLLESQWDVDGFAAIYHPYRIKAEYRSDQYDHGGESGEGEMTWADVLSEDNPHEYLKFEPHFHLFFPSERRSFDYLTAEHVQEESGWLFHRITKSDSNVSVEDLNDLVHQLTYCMSHAGIRETTNRCEFATRMKGKLHNCYPPEGIEEQILAAISEAGPTLLGTKFVNSADATCSAVVEDDEGGSHDHGHEEAPFETVGTGRSSGGGNELTGGSAGDNGDLHHAAPEPAGGDSAASEASQNGPVCGGELIPMSAAVHRADDPEWLDQAEQSDRFKQAVEEWEALDDAVRQEPFDVDHEARQLD